MVGAEGRADFHHLIDNGHVVSMCLISRYVSSPEKVGGTAEIETEHSSSKTMRFVFVS